MRRKIVLFFGAMLVLAGVATVVLALRHGKGAKPVQAAHQPATAKKPQAAAVPSEYVAMQAPAEVFLPTLDARIPVENVGLTVTGEMGVPNNFTNFGWYKDGAVPGNPGRAVMSGHAGYPERPTVFRRLLSLQKGDTIEVKDVQGNIAHFTVISAEEYVPEDAPRELIFGEGTVARLALITCTGEWLSQQQAYSHRYVVFAVRR
jgi:LPXTG-site transpeptidase (sortase) family protein